MEEPGKIIARVGESRGKRAPGNRDARDRRARLERTLVRLRAGGSLNVRALLGLARVAAAWDEADLAIEATSEALQNAAAPRSPLLPAIVTRLVEAGHADEAIRLVDLIPGAAATGLIADARRTVAEALHGRALRTLDRDAAAAAAQWMRSVTLAPKQPRAWLGLATAWFRLGRTGEAEAACRTALRLAAPAPDAYALLGEILAAQHRGTEAVTAFLTVARLSRNAGWVDAVDRWVGLLDPRSRGRLAVRLTLLRPGLLKRLAPLFQAGEAAPDNEPILRRLAASEPDRALLWRLLGDLADRAERPDRAAACLERFVRLQPGNVAMRTRLARLHVRRGRTDAATPHYRRLLADSLCAPDTLAEMIAAIASHPPEHPDRFAPVPPFVLISQLQRSGGTLLSHLFNGHPQLMVHPHEVQINQPKTQWPDLDLDRAATDWLASLFERRLPLFAEYGYTKADHNRFAAAEVHRIDVSIDALCRHFLARKTERPAVSQRAVLDAYFAAYFAAWRNFQPTGREKWTIGFCPRIALDRASVDRYFRDYPEGRILSCVRDPRGWRLSSRVHHASYADLEGAVALWCEGTRALLALADSHPGQVALVLYEDLVRDTEGEMRRLAGMLGIDWDPCLTRPTHLGHPILANSSFDVPTHGVHQEGIKHFDALPENERRYIEETAMPLYRRVADTIATMRLVTVT